MDHSHLKSLNIFEIPSIIEKASLFGGKITQPTPTKNVTSIIKRIDVDTYGMMFIKLGEEVEIAKERPVTIKLNYRNVSFLLSTEEFSIEGHTIVSQLPKEAKAIAIRPDERYAMPFNSQIMSSIYRIEKRGGNFEVNASIIDISRRGMGLVLTSTEDEEALIRNDHIWIKTIHGVTLQEPIFGTIVYAHPRKYKDGTIDIRVGVSLEHSVPEEILTELQQLCNLVLTA